MIPRNKIKLPYKGDISNHLCIKNRLTPFKYLVLNKKFPL